MFYNSFFADLRPYKIDMPLYQNNFQKYLELEAQTLSLFKRQSWCYFAMNFSKVEHDFPNFSAFPQYLGKI